MRTCRKWLRVTIWVLSGGLASATTAHAGVLLSDELVAEGRIETIRGVTPGSTQVFPKKPPIDISRDDGGETSGTAAVRELGQTIFGVAEATTPQELQSTLGAPIAGKYKTTVSWTAEYVKTDPTDVYTFTIHDGKLSLADNGGRTDDLLVASWSFGVSLDLTPVFSSGAIIIGRSRNFQLFTAGELLAAAVFNPKADLFGEGSEATYTAGPHTATISLGGINVGDTFKVEHTMEVIAENAAGETRASARIADPSGLGGIGFSGAVVTRVPQPATLALVALGFAALGWSLQRRRRD